MHGYSLGRRTGVPHMGTQSVPYRHCDLCALLAELQNFVRPMSSGGCTLTEPRESFS